MSSKKFFIIAVIFLVFVLVAVNWTEVKAAVPKITGGDAAGGTDTSGAGGSAVSKILGTGKTTTAGKSGIDYNKVLKKGVAGTEVLMLQQTLNKMNAVKRGIVAQLTEDGKFGPLTENMLKFYAGTTTITLNQAIATYQNAVG